MNVSPPTCLYYHNGNNAMNDKNNDLGSSYEDVMSLINEAKAVSDSIDQTMNDMKQHFVLGWKDTVVPVQPVKPTATKAAAKVVVTKKPAYELITSTKSTRSASPNQLKRVRFAPMSRCQIEYIQSPSPLLRQRLYYTEAEQQEMMMQMQSDVRDVEDGRPETDADDNEAEEDFTARGLERRTQEGQALRMTWRVSCRDAVLDEQDRQWNVLPLNEPCDEDEIAQVSFHATWEARKQARQLALADEQEVYDGRPSAEDNGNGTSKEDDDAVTVATALSETSWSTFKSNHSNFSCRLSSSLSSWTEEPTVNSKGCCVRWADEELEEELEIVHTYPHVETPEEKDALWYPNWSQEEAKQRWISEIAYLSTQTDREEHEDPDEERYPEDDSLRGLECLTPQAEERFQDIRLHMFLQLYSPHFKNQPLELARQCREISASSQKEAYQRGLWDEWAAHDEEQDDSLSSSSSSSSPSSSVASRLSQHPLARSFDYDDDDDSDSDYGAASSSDDEDDDELPAWLQRHA